jgi:hypothetical protein
MVSFSLGSQENYHLELLEQQQYIKEVISSFICKESNNSLLGNGCGITYR